MEDIDERRTFFGATIVDEQQSFVSNASNGAAGNLRNMDLHDVVMKATLL